jgi:hypothetical protein
MVRKGVGIFLYLQVCSRRWPPLIVISGSERSVALLFSSSCRCLGLGRAPQVARLETECWDAVQVEGCANVESYRSSNMVVIGFPKELRRY